jgi:predicted unusual protein kinase regulating ubiquinone biosynthesis (AarF/ABC1/UbiB family)
MIDLIKLIFKIFVGIIKYIFRYENYDNTIIKFLNDIGEYNIIFIKIFQWIWVKNNNDNIYITDNITKELYKYTNNTPYNDLDIDYKSLLKIFMIAQTQGDNLELLDLDPCNSGTISLIFKAKLNNKNIVIKLLRNNIRKKLEDGLNLLINIENILYNTKFINRIVSTKIFENNKINILNQIDFMNEVQNINLFNKSFSRSPEIIIPNVYIEYTKINQNFILMDYIDGKYIYELTKEELDNYFIPFVKFIMSSIFIKNILHCDLHQGNILFYKEDIGNNQIYKIGIIDMGMITKINVRELNFMYMWLMGIFNNKFLDLLEYIENEKNSLYIFEEKTNINNCVEYIKDKYNKKELFNPPNTIKELINDIYLFLKILKQYNCHLSSRYNFFILSFIPILTLIINLGPSIKKNIILQDYLEKMSNNYSE